MTDRLKVARGRATIRKGGSLTGLHGPKSRPIKLWPFAPKPNTTIERLEQAYMTGLGAVVRSRNTRAKALQAENSPQTA
jgi:hypothetical protein